MHKLFNRLLKNTHKLLRFSSTKSFSDWTWL